MQPIAESISEGQVAEIKKNVGDAVAANEVVCILETDKVTVDVLSTQSGVVTKVDAAVGDTVQVGATILTIDSDAKATPAASAPVATSANTPASKSQGIASVAPPSTAPAAIAAAPSSSIGGHRRPSIVFTHGAANKAALGSTVAYTVGHKVALVEPAMQSAPKVLGPSGTQPWAPTVLIMDENFFGNPFGVKPLTFDETAMETIMLGGATPDKPKPKDDKKEGKPVKK